MASKSTLVCICFVFQFKQYSRIDAQAAALVFLYPIEPMCLPASSSLVVSLLARRLGVVNALFAVLLLGVYAYTHEARSTAHPINKDGQGAQDSCKQSTNVSS